MRAFQPALWLSEAWAPRRGGASAPRRAERWLPHAVARWALAGTTSCPEEGGTGAAATPDCGKALQAGLGASPPSPTCSDPPWKGEGVKAAIWAEPQDSFMQTGQWGHFLWKGAWGATVRTERLTVLR